MSTLQVDRITPYQSASIQIDGDVVQANAATTGSNTFVGDQVINDAEIHLSGSASTLNIYQNISSIRFWSGSNQTEVGTWVNVQPNPADGSLTIAAFPDNNHFVYFNTQLTQSLFEAPVRLQGGVTQETSFDSNVNVSGNIKLNSNLSVGGTTELTGSVTLSGSLNVQSGNINGKDIILDDPGSNSTLLINPDYFTAYRGIVTQWQEGSNKSFMNLSEQTAEILVNGVGPGYAYDTALILQADGDGAKFRDWNGSYVYQTWLAVQPLGNPSFKRDVEVTGSVEISSVLQLAGQDPLPAGGVGQLAVSSSGDLYYHNGAGWQLK